MEDKIELLRQWRDYHWQEAIADIRKYQDRMSIDGRTIQHIADSLEELVK